MSFLVSAGSRPCAVFLDRALLRWLTQGASHEEFCLTVLTCSQPIFSSFIFAPLMVERGRVSEQLLLCSGTLVFHSPEPIENMDLPRYPVFSTSLRIHWISSIFPSQYTSENASQLPSVKKTHTCLHFHPHLNQGEAGEDRRQRARQQKYLQKRTSKSYRS